MSGLAGSHVLFLAVIALTLAITWRAARRTHTAREFYTAGERISGLQNGFAIAGDFMSAATFLGLTGLIFIGGFDTVIYFVAPLAGLAVMLALFAGPLRALGRFTLADVLATRLEERPARAFAAAATLSVSLVYLIAQIVGAGALIELLFGISYAGSVSIVGGLMVVYVAFGGMLATTWVQISKAVLLAAGITALSLLVLAANDFSLEVLYERVAGLHRLGEAAFTPGGLVPDPLSAVSLAAGLVFGMAGLPHLLIRFFTVPDVRQARRSVTVAMLVVAWVFLLIFFIVGQGTVVHVAGDGSLAGGSNMVAIHLSRALGGPLFEALMAAVAFATILAVVAGLTIASAGTIAHDLYARVLRRGRASEREEVLVSRLSAIAVGAAAILLGLVFEGQNIAYMVTLAFNIAASSSFPVLLLTLYWPGLTTRGAVAGGGIGLVAALAMVILGPAVQIDVLGRDEAPIGIRHSALISMAVSFAAIWLLSVTDRSRR